MCFHVLPTPCTAHHSVVNGTLFSEFTGPWGSLGVKVEVILLHVISTSVPKCPLLPLTSHSLLYYPSVII